MFATYKGTKKLNVRRSPATGTEVTRRLAPSESVEVDLIEGGWARCSDGWLRADLVTVTDERPELAAPATAAEPAPVEKAPEKMAEPGAEEKAERDLADMTAAELRALAKSRGVKVTARMTKPEIIALLDA